MRGGRKVNEIMEETEIEEEERSKGKTRKEDENTGKKAGG